ncbi:hypothetical protein Taro_021472, partial [Colocasia esculenta]|nr:hypothetical protein [Colocasia esculenta]
MKTSKPSGPIASADILKAKKKDFPECYGLTCDWFSRAEFEKFVDDLILRKIEVQEVVVEVSKKKHRGPTKLSSVHGLDNGKRIVVQINELGQPVGEGVHSLKLFLGTIARLGDKMSIDTPTWRAMSAIHKDDVWEYVQRYSDINKRSKSHHKYFHCAGTKSFADINEEETKLQEVKITQPSSSSSSSIATADDIYSQVFGKDRPGRVRGVGTGPAPTSLWGTSSQCQAQLRAENAQLNAMVKELAERLGKVESIVVESLMLGKKVKLCDMEGHPVANAIIMSLDKSKMVIGKSLGEEYYEVAILFAYKPNAPLFVKDNERKTVQDAVGSHIVWFRDFIEFNYLADKSWMYKYKSKHDRVNPHFLSRVECFMQFALRDMDLCSVESSTGTLYNLFCCSIDTVLTSTEVSRAFSVFPTIDSATCL